MILFVVTNVHVVKTTRKGEGRVFSTTFRPGLRGDLPAGRDSRLYPTAVIRDHDGLGPVWGVLDRAVRRQLVAQPSAPRDRGGRAGDFPESRRGEVLCPGGWNSLP